MAFWLLLKTYPSLIIYLIALIFSILSYKKYFDSFLKYLPILIGYTFLTEFLGLFIRESDAFAIIYSQGNEYLNSLIFNIFDIFFFLYFLFIYWKALDDARQKKWIKNGGLLFVLVSIINPFFQSFSLEPQIYSMLIGSFFIISAAILYFKQVNGFKGESNRKLLSWVSLGLLIFYPFYPIIFFIVIYFDDALYRMLHLNIIHQILICLMYCCFIIGFIRMNRMKPIQKV